MINGVITAMITPFRDGKIDYASLVKIIALQAKSGVAGLLLFGSTGEGPSIEPEEYGMVISFVADWLRQNAPKIKLIVGASAATAALVVKSCEVAANKGADAVLISPPAYSKPTQDGILDIYIKASALGIPIIAYNVPSRVCVNISDETVLRIAELPNCVGIKDSTGDIRRIVSLKQGIKNDKFAVLAGDDYMFLAGMVHGANGLISVASNLIPHTMAKIYSMCTTSAYCEASNVFANIYGMMDSLFCCINPIPVKYAAGYLGIIESAETRSPLTPLCDLHQIDRIVHEVSKAMAKEKIFMA